jgi:hypothetical protein
VTEDYDPDDYCVEWGRLRFCGYSDQTFQKSEDIMADKTPLHTIGDIRIDDDDTTWIYGQAITNTKATQIKTIAILVNGTRQHLKMKAEKDIAKDEFGWFVVEHDTSQDEGLE